MWGDGRKTNSGKRQFDVTEIFIPRSFVYTFIVKIESTVEGALSLLAVVFYFFGCIAEQSAVAAAVRGGGKNEAKVETIQNCLMLKNPESEHIEEQREKKKKVFLCSLCTLRCVVLLSSCFCRRLLKLLRSHSFPAFHAASMPFHLFKF